MTVTKKGERLWLTFGFSKELIKEVKTSFVKYKWHGYDKPNPIKKWSVQDCQHNWFQIQYLAGLNPYAIYELPLTPYERVGDPNERGLYQYFFKDYNYTTRYIFEHQAEFTAEVLTRRYKIQAHEMGTGKTLAMISVMEASGIDEWLWVGPKYALIAVQMEFIKWKSKITPTYRSYSILKKLVEEWPAGLPAYQGVVFDEGQKLKTPSSQRSEAAQYIGDCTRDEWGYEGILVDMSGSPAPKSPIDWLSQCEIVQPGYLKENHISTLKSRLAIIQDRENVITGGVYPHLVTWLDDENKCAICGEFKDHENHDDFSLDHMFQPSVNEVAKLQRRMSGLVSVKFKRDCLDLPEKVYREIQCEPSAETLRFADFILKTSPSAIKALTGLRELSDGFQYKEEITGKEPCPTCLMKGTIVQPVYIGPPKTEEFIRSLGLEWNIHEEATPIDPVAFNQFYKFDEDVCPNCKGVKEVPSYTREIKEVACVKDDIMTELFEDHDDYGRLVCYAGFTASIQRIMRLTKDSKWDFIKWDGQGISSTLDTNDPKTLLDIFQNGQSTRKKLCFIGHPASAGTGLTLTASPSIAYFSNDFSAESRIQSEDRIHRPGCLGANIIDILNLSSDKYVLDNLKSKRDLQAITLGDLKCISFAS